MTYRQRSGGGFCVASCGPAAMAAAQYPDSFRQIAGKRFHVNAGRCSRSLDLRGDPLVGENPGYLRSRLRRQLEIRNDGFGLDPEGTEDGEGRFRGPRRRGSDRRYNQVREEEIPRPGKCRIMAGGADRRPRQESRIGPPFITPQIENEVELFPAERPDQTEGLPNPFPDLEDLWRMTLRGKQGSIPCTKQHRDFRPWPGLPDNPEGGKGPDHVADVAELDDQDAADRQWPGGRASRILEIDHPAGLFMGKTGRSEASCRRSL